MTHRQDLLDAQRFRVLRDNIDQWSPVEGRYGISHFLIFGLDGELEREVENISQVADVLLEGTPDPIGVGESTRTEADGGECESCESPGCTNLAVSPVHRFCKECRETERQLIGADEIEREFEADGGEG